MPHINRVRVNNVKYNFGTQIYDDFMMKPFGHNMLYDLANGGGKSVLMLLLLQNVLPNCTLDEKQPIEKLFRTGDGSSTIHSLIEWKLDEQDVVHGYQYMTTGFCARKALQKEEFDDSIQDTASIEYFNYCIFYREYNENDIQNLPLIKDKERITYTGLKKYLKELERNPQYIVRIFDVKRDYQAFISQYGIYESEWEIIRGINKTEGHVRTYFEANYKTTRKVVEDLLIEEIIQKSFQKRAMEEEETISNTLLDLREKLTELSQKEKEYQNYDQQIDLLCELSEETKKILLQYEKKEEYIKKLGELYDYANMLLNSASKEYEQQQKQTDELSNTILYYEKKLEQSRIYQSQCKRQEILKELEEKQKEWHEIAQKVEELNMTLRRKKAGNEYLVYLAEKQKRNEAMQTLKAVKQQKEGLGEQIACYVYYIKDYLDALKDKLEQELEELGKKKDGLIKKRDHLQEEAFETERKLAVAKTMKEQIKDSIGLLNKELIQEKSEAGIFLIEELNDATIRCKDELKILSEERKKQQENLLSIKEQIKKRSFILEKNKLYLQELKNQEEKQDQWMISFAKEKSKIDQLEKVYQKDNYDQLLIEIHRQLKQSIQRGSAISKEKEEVREELVRLTQGDFSMDDSLLMKAKEYLMERYPISIVTGVEYLGAKSKEEQLKLLMNLPFLPYALVVIQGYDTVGHELRLYGRQFESMVIPVVTEECFMQRGNRILSDQIMLLSKDQSLLYDKKRLEEEVCFLKEREETLTEQLHQVEEQEEVCVKDKATLEVFLSKTMQQCAQIKKEQRETKARIEDITKEVQDSTEKMQELLLLEEQQETLIGNLSHDVLLKTKQQDCMLRAVKLVDRINLALDSKREWEEKEQLIITEREKLKISISETKDSLKELISIESAKREQRSQIISQWEQKYQMFYAEGEYERPNLLPEEMIEILNGSIQAIMEENGDLEDKNRLINSYVQAMNRSLKEIEHQGVSLAELKLQKEQGILYETPEEELLRIQEVYHQAEELYKESQVQIQKKQSIYDRYDGMIQQAMLSFEEKYGTYQDVDMESVHYDSFEQEAKLKIQATKEKMEQFKDEMLHLKRLEQEYESLQKDILRLLKEQEWIHSENLTYDLPRITISKLKEQYNKLEESWDVQEKQEREEAEQFFALRKKVIQRLQDISATGLALEIEESVKHPKTREEASILIQSLSEVNECLVLEKTRITEGIAQMQQIKQNFENQCIQRCVYVKNELSRLPNLSKITLNQEQIPMIRLSIPYVKEELVPQKMSEYIDRVVKESSESKDPMEQLKIIRSALTLKRLFSVIVTDMNAIRFMLYKRERMKEQSRHLRYEEAVGSTGQSQGIYIQFLISIITYISHINSRKPEDTSLKKVIFLDNPFGAAKDTYIWEPIFELLEQNKVQLIVPARGTTPAITSRFDVNYILGQRMNEDRQQVVVVDYYSSVVARETEFTPLKYEQTSMSLD